jgi:hypothetical protein
MTKIRGKDFAKTVIITPEENDALKRKEAAKQQATPKPVTQDPIIGGEVKGPPKGLSRWSIFFLVVIALVLGVGFFIYSST